MPKNHLGTVSDYDDSSALREAMENCTTCSELDWRTFNLEKETSREETLTNELKRLQALKSYRILDTDRKASFERLTALAARIFDVPICLVSLVDLGRQWFASNRGLGDVRETPRKVAFCAHAILSEMDLFIVPDALKDPRFRTNSLVTGEPHIRFYAGCPLVTRDGYKLGTLCIIDTKTRPNGLTLSQKQNLSEIAALVMDQIESTKIDQDKAELAQSKLIACTAHDLITPLTSIQLNMGLLTEDEELINRLTKCQKDTIRNAKECVDIMSSICQYSIKSFRGKSTEGLLDLEHHEAGTVNIAKFLESIDHIICTHPKKVPLTMTVDEDVPPIIKSEVLTIFRSSLNFITNSCKVTETGQIDFRIFKESKGEDSQDSLVFECTDTGPGVEQYDIARLFTANGGLQLSQKSKSGGLGLGLHSVSELISALGGNFGYSPNAKHKSGSVFWFSVPLVLPSEQVELSKNDELELSDSIRDLEVEVHRDIKETAEMKPTSMSLSRSTDDLTDNSDHNHKVIPTSAKDEEKIELPPVKRKSQVDMGKDKRLQLSPDSDYSDSSLSQRTAKRAKCALVIDDSKTIRKVIERALKNFGFYVVQAENGLQGLEEMKTTVFDIVLCDFLMPIMDGMDCVQQYRHWEKGNRAWFQQYIVGISAHADDDDGDRGVKVGMNKFIQKPLPIKILRQLVDSKEMAEVSKKLDALLENENALKYFFYVNPAVTGKEFNGSATSSISDDFQPTCLVVEDCTSVRKAMIRCIQRQKWQICFAKDGEEALRLLQKRNWEAVFMDDQLPVCTGSACVEKFREWEKKNRVARQMNLIMCSANEFPGNKPPPGFDGIMSKPFKPSTLTSILEKCSSNRKVSLL